MLAGRDRVLRRRSVCAERCAELPARGDAELGTDAVEVGRDRAMGEVEAPADFAIGEAGGGELGDLELLSVETVSGLRAATPARLARRAQLAASRSLHDAPARRRQSRASTRSPGAAREPTSISPEPVCVRRYLCRRAHLTPDPPNGGFTPLAARLLARGRRLPVLGVICDGGRRFCVDAPLFAGQALVRLGVTGGIASFRRRGLPGLLLLRHSLTRVAQTGDRPRLALFFVHGSGDTRNLATGLSLSLALCLSATELPLAIAGSPKQRRSTEALAQLGRVEDVPGGRVREDQSPPRRASTSAGSSARARLDARAADPPGAVPAGAPARSTTA
jgi:hypothetical protein